MMDSISFFNEDISFDLPEETKIMKWIADVASSEGFSIEEINYIFCSDEYLLQVNKEYLEHDYYTDIITFDNSDKQKVIVSDIFISVDRVEENARDLKVDFLQELHRVMIHGILHLLGYQDKTSDDKTLMRKKEDTCLSLLQDL